MRIGRKNLSTSLILVFGLFLNNVSLAHSVEFGQDATGDPNVVRINGGASGFLYSDRLVFTAAHNFDGSENWSNLGFVNAPGVNSTSEQKKYNIHKILKASTYRARLGADNTRIDDFAILILSESIPMQNKVEVASPADIESFIREKVSVEMAGYGFQNEAQRSEKQAWKDRAPRKMTSILLSGEDLRKYYAAYPLWHQPNQTILDFGIPNNATIGSNCDGDSGAGFFVEKSNIRYYLGAAGGSQAGITNCNGSFTRFAPNGGMSGVNPAHKSLALIKEAEDFVANEKKLEAAREEARAAAELKVKQDIEAAAAKAAAEIKAKQEAEAKSALERAAMELKAKQEEETKAAALKKVTITCVKGKLTKKVTAVKPVCPKGYKKK